MRVLLANPRGFCAGVNMAIDSLEKALELLGPPIYVYHEIIHNKYVVNRFREKGVVFVDDLQEIPEGAVLFYSAHGVSPEIRRASAERNLRAIDATCPLVTKVHLEAVRFAREGYTIVLIGHEGHDEVLGTMGEVPGHIRLVQDAEEVSRLNFPPGARLAYLTQTTLSVDDAEVIVAALKRRFPHIVGPSRDDICYATQNRQAAVQVIARDADVVLVVGSPNSSNSVRLVEVAKDAGAGAAYLVEDASSIRPEWLAEAGTVGLSSGASVPEDLVEGVLARLAESGFTDVQDVEAIPERMQFALPHELRQGRSDRARQRP